MRSSYLFLPLALAGLTLSLQAQHRPVRNQKPASAKAPADVDPALAASIKRGQAVYKQTCLTCHQADGGGVPSFNPPLSQTTYVLGDKTRLVHIVLAGLAEPVEINGDVYKQHMPAQSDLTDQEVADVLTYVRNNFGNKASAVQLAEVKAVRATLK